MNYINICKGTHRRQVHIASLHEFFHSRVGYEIFHDKLVFKLYTIDYQGKSISPTHINSGWYEIQLVAEIELGKYLIDEDESNEDQLVIYFEDKIE